MAEKFSPVVHRVARVLITRPLQLFCDYSFIDRENLPVKGPAILASNHVSYWDPVVISVGHPGVINWMAKAELWKVPILRGFIERVGTFPVNRGEPDREAFRQSKEILAEGGILGIFPEGTRVRKGKQPEPSAGVGMIALKANVPVIPIGVDLHHGRLGRPHMVVSIGRPVELELTGMSKARAYKEATSRIMKAIYKL